MLMHQGIGLDRFNALPYRKAVHALYECCTSLVWAGRLASGRPYSSHAALHSRADDEIFSLPESEIDVILESHPAIGKRANSPKSSGEQCAFAAADSLQLAQLHAAAGRYEAHFGHKYIFWPGDATIETALQIVQERTGNDAETERKVLRDELARINRVRIERLLGPEGGYPEF
jgi:2-oxo-4-hydroxy-4-carboxy-5-ureidoimidazoline decarboxylase